MSESEQEHSIPSSISTETGASLTLVPNHRRLRMHVADCLRDLGDHAVAVAPPVRVFSQWVEDLLVRINLLEGKAAPCAIGPPALRDLWRNVIDDGSTSLTAAECYLAAGQARAADRLINHWWPSDEPPSLEQGYWKWRNRVWRGLQANGQLHPEGFMQKLVDRLGDGCALPLALPEELFLDGFHEITVLETSVLNALQGRGVGVCAVQPPAAANARVRIFDFDTLDEELSAAAHWAGNQLRKGRSQIAVVVNGLEKLAATVRTVFENVICTDRRMALDELIDCEFHVSQGEPLDSHPAIADALMLLSLLEGGDRRKREFPLVSRWLLSPYWSSADSERASRAHLEYRLRRTGRYWYSVDEILNLARRWGLADRLPALYERTAMAFVTISDTGKGNRSAGEWFLDCLAAWAWPGPLARGSEMALRVSQMASLLEHLDSLHMEYPAEALARLRQRCAETRAVLRGGPLSPVQVLTPEDAAGRRFDSVWIANVHEGNWPGRPQVNPFLPAHTLDRIPRGTAGGELAYCERLTEELRHLAPEVFFSWSRQSDDMPNEISPLLSDLRAGTAEPVRPAALHARAAPQSLKLKGYRQHPWLQAVEDRNGLPLTPAGAIRGGSGMIRDQSACPMMAYLVHRLDARFESMPEAFADPAYRGSLTHSALHALYREQVGKPGAAPVDRIEAAVTEALQHNRARQRLLPVSYQAERLRLISLLKEWLDLEVRRAGFSVHQLERPFTGELLGHEISVRIDRIDRMEDGRLLLIDYKSSGGNTAAWARDRLQQAQLPLYAVMLSGSGVPEVSGIALAAVRGGECHFSGVTDDELACFDGIHTLDNRKRSLARRFQSWGDLLDHWRASVGSLTAEIVAGCTDNTVYDPGPVRWSGLESLLRHEEGHAWLLEHELSSHRSSGVGQHAD